MAKPGRKPGSIPWNKGLTRLEDQRIGRPPWTAHHRSQETIEKIREAKRGFRHTPESRAKIAIAMRGRLLSPEARARIATAMQNLGRPEHMKGMKSARWTGTNRKTFRRLTLERDSYTCQVCGAPAREADHIIPIRDAPEKMFDLDNLQSLCHSCHRIKTNQEVGSRHPILRNFERQGDAGESRDAIHTEEHPISL